MRRLINVKHHNAHTVTPPRVAPPRASSALRSVNASRNGSLLGRVVRVVYKTEALARKAAAIEAARVDMENAIAQWAAAEIYASQSRE